MASLYMNNYMYDEPEDCGYENEYEQNYGMGITVGARSERTYGAKGEFDDDIRALLAQAHLFRRPAQTMAPMPRQNIPVPRLSVY